MPERKKPFPEVPLPESEDSESESVSVTEPEMSEIEPETPETEFEVTEQDSGEENLSVPKIPMANGDSEVAVKADPTEVEEEYYDDVIDADVELEVSDLGDQTIDAEEYDDDYEEYSDLSPEQNQDTKNEAPSSDSSETAVAHPQKPARKTAIRKVRSLDEYVLNNGDYNQGIIQKANMLRRTQGTKSILKAKVIKAVTKKRGKNSNLENVYVVCMVPGYEEFEFLIPFKDLDAVGFEYFTSNSPLSKIPYSNVPKTAKINYIRRMLHAKININIVAVSAQSRRVICNRETANFLMRHQYFYLGRKLSNITNIRHTIQSGTIINNVSVIMARHSFVLAEAFGAQFRIPLSEISHRYIRNAFFLHAGETVNVLLKNVEIDKDRIDTAPVTIEASIKALEEDYPRIALENAEEGEIVTGKIVTIDVKHIPRGVTDTGYNFRIDIIKDHIKQMRIGSEVTIKLIKKVLNANICFAIVDLLEVNVF